jgi:hypothetical protein
MPIIDKVKQKIIFHEAMDNPKKKKAGLSHLTTLLCSNWTFISSKVSGIAKLLAQDVKPVKIFCSTPL